MWSFKRIEKQKNTRKTKNPAFLPGVCLIERYFVATTDCSGERFQRKIIKTDQIARIQQATKLVFMYSSPFLSVDCTKINYFPKNLKSI